MSEAEHMWDIVVNEQRYTPKPGDRVLDLGAAVGHFTFYCASRGAIVTAYEPRTDAFLRLSELLRKEPWADRVVAVNRGVWTDDGMSPLRWDANDRAASMLRPGNNGQICGHDALTKVLGIDPWDCVKVDIEGAEYATFTGADLGNIIYLTMELHPDTCDVSTELVLLEHLKVQFDCGEVEFVEERRNGSATGRINKAFCKRRSK